MQSRFSYLILILVVALVSCKKPKTYPSEPSITFKEMVKTVGSQGLDSSVVLTISFIDGDGDIGDTANVFNLFIDFFKKTNGVFEQVPLLVPGYKIPWVYHEGKDQSLSGDIVTNLKVDDFGFNFDTLRFDCYMYDRALHKSNTITTPEIVLKTP
ncbi:MAG: hypothetical protein ABIT08_17625 [Bacteroidia bacterium]